MKENNSMIFRVHDLIRELERRCSELNVNLKIDPTATTAKARPGEIVFPAIFAPISEYNFIKLKGFSIHEPLHLLRKEIFDICVREKIENGSKLGTIYNSVEDGVMERIHCRTYKGDAKDLGNFYSVVSKENENKFRELLASGYEPNKDEVNILSTMLLMAEARKEWDDIFADNAPNYGDAFPKEVQEKFKELKSKGWISRLNTGDYTPEETFQLAKELYEDITKQSANDPECRQKPNGGEEGKDKASGKGKPGKEVGEDKGGFDKKIQEIKWEDIQHSPAETEQGTPQPSRINWEGKKFQKGNWIPYPATHIEEIDLKIKGRTNSYREVTPLDSIEAASFANQVKRLILVETRSDFISERKTGKISARNIHRITLPMRGDGDWNSRIFKKRVDHRNVDTCVTVLVDWSGSMTGEKMQLAANSVERLDKVFATTLRIPFEVLAFTESGQNLIHGIVKDYKELSVPDKAIITRFNKFTGYTSGNADADSLIWAVTRIRRRPEKKKVLIVLSDGSPADGYYDGVVHTDAFGALKEATEAIYNKKDVDLHGIGIMDKNVTQFYRNSQVINDVNELEHALLTTLKAIVTQGISHELH